MSAFNFNPFQLTQRHRGLSQSQEGIIPESREDVLGMEELKSSSSTRNKTKEEKKGPSGRCWRKLRLSRRGAWRLTSAFMGLFFLLAAAVQHNDPDPYLWMVGLPILEQLYISSQILVD
jgi:hypothetical protein